MLSQQPKKSGPCSHQKKLSEVEERIKSLKLAMEKARGVPCVTVLEQYCALDMVVTFCIEEVQFSCTFWSHHNVQNVLIAFEATPRTC